MQKQSNINSAELSRRSEELIKASSNRYRAVVQVANRAKRRRYEDFDNFDEQAVKPVIRAVLEMSDELMQPEIISDVGTNIDR
ncbi:MAG: DNA-directed RNA polymerase subunit omega [Okeania sp. SIO3I5]|uniref:DNA-directed RNA polymerase subunit omega n=1 Tax=Okeania sp. SIO3I5 TaxID=2607805 RepID=UPI0013BAE78F|nr:DNA-directed RNA polymerase subunit omega [Okeania sp. SIO3I5]NEQ34793.1 DNA-directed RNA polymerase subunit omega [Okeania sp. SIO3I5]